MNTNINTRRKKNNCANMNSIKREEQYRHKTIKINKLLKDFIKIKSSLQMISKIENQY